ncbi:MAG: DNA-binding transcriptional regulator [Planctomycetes bacterium]|nr:DNA-binding transcriptional regulator [Planctomycetota bacterium]
MLGCSRASERGFLRGIARYSRFHGPWIFYREPPFYRMPPYRRWPKGAKVPVSPRQRGFDGLIAFAANRVQLESFIPRGFPAVVLPVEEKIPGYCSIVEAADTVGRTAAEHFLDRGFTRFAFCGFDHLYWSRVRQEGFVRRLAEAGFPVHLYEPPGPAVRTPETEQTSMADWLRSLPRPIALLACNDDRAQQIVEANKTAGIRIPDEIAILGVDNDDMICELTHPPLSSIALNCDEAGYEAAAQLDRQMRGQKASVPEIHLHPTHVQTRQSTEVSALDDAVVARAMHFIRTHAGEVLSVDDVVEAAAASRRVLERRFRRTVGAGIYREIQRARLERACRMLVETHWSLADIAGRCGFSGVVHFGVAFKRQMGHTPQQHRRSSTRLSGVAAAPTDPLRPEERPGRKIERRRRKIE